MNISVSDSLMRSSNCYLCNSPGQLLFQGLTDRLFAAGGIWNIKNCKNCQLAWIDPTPNAEDIPKLYETYFTHESENGRSRWSPFVERLKSGVLAGSYGYRVPEHSSRSALIDRLVCSVEPAREYMGGDIMWLPSNWCGDLLDVGCGSGEFLARMKALNWNVAGMEPDPKALDVAQARLGISVKSRLTEFSSGQFDVITMNHVIEHLPDPIAVLRECKRLLKPSGRLLITTPNKASLGARWFGRNWVALEPPRHLMLFTNKSLRSCVERSDLTVESVDTLAKSAHFVWYASRLIRRHGAVPYSSMAGRASTVMHIQGILFWFIELFLRSRGMGEETVLLARRA
jgi:SAM-dependent methyltransferase